ncbi:MAG: glycosyltransferase family 2 protein [Lachnospiraceae bacterium]|nr:glycosyltransferase family 2 protein [Lachnospiraceae bacterium]
MSKLEVLVAAVQENEVTLAEHMNLSTEAVICNQCQLFEYKEFERKGRLVRCYEFTERGVGRNRNNALMRAEGELVLFGDEDIVYNDDYEERVLRAFEENPQADILMFNVTAVESRQTYENVRPKPVRWYNYGRYPTYAMCARLESLRKANVWFSLLFGGGAPYSNGEDTLFIHDCLKRRLKIYAVPVIIGHEMARENNESTWFNGYNEKFFYDRGVLYHYLYGIMERPFALRFLLTKRKTMCVQIPLHKAYALMVKGMKEA